MIGATVALALATAVAGAILLERSAAQLGAIWEDWLDSSGLDSALNGAILQLREAGFVDGQRESELTARATASIRAALAELPASDEARLIRGALDDLTAGEARPATPAARESALTALAAAHAALRDAERARLSHRQAAALATLRGVILGLTLGFALLINALVAMILRAFRLIIEPVEELVQATKDVARGRYSARVRTASAGEFGALARAFNSMAQDLERSEASRVETMRQAAASINHELNNAIASLDMQLDLISRASARGRPIESSILRARGAIARIGKTTETLRRVKRIVLTQYAGGETMLDLARSSQAEDDAPPAVEG